jgi:hypothetical protein
MTKSKMIFTAAAFLFCLGIAPSFFPGRCAERPTKPAIISVAVLDFQSSGAKLAEMGPQAAILLNARLSGLNNLVLVERQDLGKLLAEQELGISGTITPDTAAKIGHLTGAKILVTGRVFESGSKLLLIAKVMGTETSRVFGEEVGIPNPESIEDGITALANKIGNVIKENANDLMAEPESKKDLVAKLKKTVVGRRLPAVAISIQERHFGQAVADPAVETEFISVLKQLGFDIVDSKQSTRMPDVTINGEAFSETGAHVGNLIVCKSRVEIKATKRNGGELIGADRQTEVAVDLSERIAGKNALQSAASKLIGRLVPKL